MFLLVSVRHVGAHPDELQLGVSIQSSINLGKTFLRISRIRIIPSTQILARVFVYLPPFISKILGRVVQTPVSANPGLNFNPGFFFFLSKALSRIIFSIIFKVSNHQIVGKKN